MLLLRKSIDSITPYDSVFESNKAKVTLETHRPDLSLTNGPLTISTTLNWLINQRDKEKINSFRYALYQSINGSDFQFYFESTLINIFKTKRLQ